VAGWLKPGGRLFVHIFCHRELLYPFEDRDGSDWMARHFFTGGIMPAELTLAHFQQHLELEQQWRVRGGHYRRTARAWLQRADAARAPLLSLLATVYGERQAARWLQRWRMFFIAVEELFGYDDGNQWFVTHCLMRRRG
jgi:cyclopropane-fatty-acyl-phospholipid synthase